MTQTIEPRVVKIFITHQWFSMEFPVGTDNEHWTIYSWLMEAEEEEGWFIKDESIPPEKGLFDANSIKDIRELVESRMAASDIVIYAGAGLYHQSREWLLREARMARTTRAGTRPVLCVRPKSGYWWSSYFTDRADAWAIWTRKSVVDGVRALLEISPSRRSELLERATPCKTCGKRRARLEVNRLRGVYCANCGTVAYRLNRRPLPCWRDWDRRWPLEIEPVTRRQAFAAVRKDDPAALAEAAISVGWFVPANDWGVGFCTDLTSHPHPHVRGSAVRALCLRTQVDMSSLDKRLFKRVARAAMRDEHRYVRAQGYLLAARLERELGWRIGV